MRSLVRHSVLSFSSVLAALALVAIPLGCRSKDASDAVSGLASAGSATTIAGPASVVLRVPAGAVTTDTRLTVATIPSASPPPGTASVAVPIRLGPAGQTFEKAVELEVPVSPSSLPPGSTLNNVVAMRAPQGTTAFVPLPTRPAGPASVAVITEHFSDFVFVVRDTDGGGFSECGDSMCAAETCSDCPLDCGLCLSVAGCGDLQCGVGESFTSCPYDCTLPATYVDAVTGLEWQRYLDVTTFDWTNAASYCSTLGLDGRNDWRLPTRLEALSIVDYSFSLPAFQSWVFPNVPPSTTFWTSTDASLITPGNAWWIDATDGRAVAAAQVTATNVRCVRTNTTGLSGMLDNGDGTVTDRATGLTWQQIPDPMLYTQAGAATLCSGLALGGTAAGTWRLPTVAELQTIVDDTAFIPAIDATLFPNAIATVEFYWTSSTYAPNPVSSWMLWFDTGYPASADPASTGAVRCVR